VSKDRPARPWDVFNSQLRAVPPHIAEARMALCEACPEYIKVAKMCGICKCIMPAKTTLVNSECPIHKWGQISFSITEPGVIHNDGLPRKA
jgi:hypothetical protein